MLRVGAFPALTPCLGYPFITHWPVPDVLGSGKSGAGGELKGSEEREIQGAAA